MLHASKLPRIHIPKFPPLKAVHHAIHRAFVLWHLLWELGTVLIVAGALVLGFVFVVRWAERATRDPPEPGEDHYSFRGKAS